MKNVNSTKGRLIETALGSIADMGWVDSALAHAEKAGGFEAGIYKAYFPGGISDFVRAFHLWVDEGMEARLNKLPHYADSKVREKIYQAVMARINVMEPHRAAVRRLVMHQLLPWNGPRALFDLSHAADAMWKAAGDRSVDYNYYTKRVLLSGVYVATLRFWLRDESKDYAETRAYLRRRIEDVLKVGQKIGSLKERFKGAA
jgi:ubiquinone biosynthesis protein COQ9